MNCPDYTPEQIERIRSIAPKMLQALIGLTTNKHIDLGDMIYAVRERECEGWHGPSVTAWNDAVMLANECVRAATGEQR